MRVFILLTCAKNMHDHIISFIRDGGMGGGFRKTSLTTPPLLFIEVHVPIGESEWLCICVVGTLLLSLSGIFLSDFETVLLLPYFLFSF